MPRQYLMVSYDLILLD